MFADFLKKLVQPAPEPLGDTDARLAMTALLVRLARSDGYYAAPEIIRIEKIIGARYGLTHDEAVDLRERAERLEEEAPDTVRFTRAIKEAVSYDDRIGVVEALWQVALADGERDADEDSLIRLAANLLGVNDRDSALARQPHDEALLIASLPMYDRPEVQAANDRLWSGIREHLGTGPGMLLRSDNLWDQWLSPDLLLSQTCGYPYRARLHGKVTLVGTPVYRLPGCPPGHYQSIFVARTDDPRETPADFAKARFAYNEDLSQSGWAAPQNFAISQGFTFANPVQSGGHLFSAKMVAEGQADCASLDALSWKMIQRYEPFAGSLKVIGRTKPTPVLPYITALDRNPDPIFAAIEVAIAGLDATDRDALSLYGIVRIPAEEYLCVPNPPSPSEV